MFSIYRKIDDTIILDNKPYKINASFDNILRLIELSNEEITSTMQIEIAIKMLFGRDINMKLYTIVEWREIYQSVIDEYLSSKQKVEYDELGEPMPVVEKSNKRIIDITKDSGFIYAGFMQAYGIDLIEQQGKMHWYKFTALLSGLPKDTRMREIMGYRAYTKPSKHDTHHKQMLELQKAYSLEDEEDEEVEDFG